MIRNLLRKLSWTAPLRRDLKRSLQLMGLMPNIHIPDPLWPDDTFVVSYPKSGNTWLRFMLAHMRFPDAEIDFHTISDYIPAGAGTADRLWHNQINTIRPRFIKSHVRYQPKFPRVIYLVRDGRAVYVSYYRFMFDRLPVGTTLADFIRKRDLRFGSWSQNVCSWLDAGLPPERFLMIKYEDMLEAPLDILSKISKFSHLNWSETTMRVAIQHSSFKQMRELEKQKGLPDQNVHSGKFVRQGKARSWQSEFGEHEIQVFKECHNRALIRLAYETHKDW